MMTAKRKLACELYINGPLECLANMSESCKQAGYSMISARNAATCIMRDHECISYMEELRSHKQIRMSLTKDEKRAALAKIVSSDKARNSDVIKALELLSKIDGDMAPTRTENTNYDGDLDARQLQELARIQREAIVESDLIVAGARARNADWEGPSSDVQKTHESGT